MSPIRSADPTDEEPWWVQHEYDRYLAHFLTRFSFNTAKESVTVASGRYSYETIAWDVQGTMPAEAVERLGVSREEAFVYTQVIRGLAQAAPLSDYAGVRINRAWSAVAPLVDETDETDPSAVRRIVRVFLDEYRPKRSATKYVVLRGFREGAGIVWLAQGKAANEYLDIASDVLSDPRLRIYTQASAAERKADTLRARGARARVVSEAEVLAETVRGDAATPKVGA